MRLCARLVGDEVKIKDPPSLEGSYYVYPSRPSRASLYPLSLILIYSVRPNTSASSSYPLHRRAPTFDGITIALILFLSAYNTHPMLSSSSRYSISILVMTANDLFAFFLLSLGSLRSIGMVSRCT
ncbi:hypothetical protein DFP72DRAFT_634551 [Ephemerocybe angulata]|uniref:Uncharacterized protein n=1 Tax=Ephemerocybe angulata TaxID=980116 RepID=A0A8H6HHP6_9AGAR|nr:hypothetical protein DFP72DRAFT_634551 [Tulosesus angulatus]